jgi:arginine N-succinyltransferase
MVDIFEAGPVVRCALNQIRTIRESRQTTLTAIADAPTPEGAQIYLISNCRHDYRAAKAPLTVSDAGHVTLPPDLAAALNLQPGDPLRYAPLRATPKAHRYHDANVSFD